MRLLWICCVRPHLFAFNSRTTLASSPVPGTSAGVPPSAAFLSRGGSLAAANSNRRITLLAKAPMLRNAISRSFRLPWLATPTMTREDSELSELRSARPEMSSVAEMHDLVVEAAGTSPASNWKERVHAAARILDLPFGRAKRHYYGEARRVEAE